MKKNQVEHGTVCRLAGDHFGYFGWPSIGRMDDGRLIVSSSGLRTEHICPFGKTVINISKDDGYTWSSPQVINDSPIDDRDAGVLNLGGESILLSWFTSDTRNYLQRNRSKMSPEDIASWEGVFEGWSDSIVQEWLGSWVILTQDGKTWSNPIKVPVSAPHGPTRLANGDLLYLGKYGFDNGGQHSGKIMTCRSTDKGQTWTQLGAVPIFPGTRLENYHEPHLVELQNGKLLGLIRFQYWGEDDPAIDQIDFSLFQTESSDGGQTWTQARPSGIYGSPPHLLGHSSGAIVCVYGYRQPPYGQRAIISHDGGENWEADLILRDDGPDRDLGYPASVELADGSILTIYYQKFKPEEKCSLLWTRWRLP